MTYVMILYLVLVLVLTVSGNTVILELKTTKQQHRRRLETIGASDENRGELIESRIRDKVAAMELENKIVLDLLETFRVLKRRVTYDVHWITNRITVQGASDELLEQLEILDQVERIRAPKLIPMKKPVDKTIPRSLKSQDTSNNPVYDEAIRRMQAGENQMNIEKIEAPKSWESFNNRGEGIVIGSIDTGVRGSHVILKDSYIGNENYGWYDPSFRSQDPTDADGHGSHTMGTIVGSYGVGVAPGAKWMACVACTTSGCYDYNLIACAEFLACPHDSTGNKATKDCSKAPHIINNSWGGSNEAFYQDIVNSWHEFGIIPVFGSGDDGNDNTCDTLISPADSPNVIAVGATTIEDALATFSSKGPGGDGVKPDISAPGQFIVSAASLTDDSVVLLSGSSMAAPHVSGLIALILSRDKTKRYDQILQTIRDSAVKDKLVSSGTTATCGDTPDTTFPNNFFGHGRINVFTALSGGSVQAQVPENSPMLPPVITPVEAIDEPEAVKVISTVSKALPAAPTSKPAAPVPPASKRVSMIKASDYNVDCNSPSKAKEASCFSSYNAICNSKKAGTIGWAGSFNGDIFQVSCIESTAIEDVEIETIKIKHSNCDSVSKATAGSCVAGVNRYCNNHKDKPSNVRWSGVFQGAIGTDKFKIGCFKTSGYDKQLSRQVLVDRNSKCTPTDIRTSHCFDSMQKQCEATKKGDIGLVVESNAKGIALVCARKSLSVGVRLA